MFKWIGAILVLGLDARFFGGALNGMLGLS